MDQVGTILNSQTEELDRKLHEQMSLHKEGKRDWKNVEKALTGQIKQVKTISKMESERGKVINTLPRHIKNRRTHISKQMESIKWTPSSKVKLRNCAES